MLKAGPVAVVPYLRRRIEYEQSEVSRYDLFDPSDERAVCGLVGAAISSALLPPASISPVRNLAASDCNCVGRSA